MSVEDHPPSSTSAQLALQRYAAATSRQRIVYFGIVGAVVVALVAFVAVFWSRGEAAHTTLHTAPRPAKSVALGTPASFPQLRWTTTDQTATGVPYWNGDVVTYDRDSVRGRDAATGAIAWSYTRTDRTVCQVIQEQGVAVAVFELAGNCDEVTALDAGTGQRKWTRTLDQDGNPVNGRPLISATTYTIMITTPHVIYAIDPGGGLDRWTFAQAGCTINSAVLGSNGALISQTCSAPKCDGLKFCGAGTQLLLRDPNAGHSDDDKDKANPDQIKWDLIGNRSVPASADQLVSAVGASGQLEIHDLSNGKQTGQVELPGAPAPPANTASGAAVLVSQATSTAQVLWFDATIFAVDVAGKHALWSAPAAAAPTITPGPGQPSAITPSLPGSLVAVATGSGIALLDGTSGRPTRTFAVSAPSPGSLVYPFGTGFLIAGASTVLYQ